MRSLPRLLLLLACLPIAAALDIAFNANAPGNRGGSGGQRIFRNSGTVEAAMRENGTAQPRHPLRHGGRSEPAIKRR